MSENSNTTFIGKLLIFLFVAGCFYGAYHFFFRKSEPGVPAGNGPGISSQNTADPGAIEIGIAYGTEKRRWLEWAVDRFKTTEEGKSIKVNLIPMGSLEGAQAILASDKRIHVWSPASALYKDIFVQDWEVKHGGNPIAKEEALALTPMVFVMWEERYQEFIKKYKSVTFTTISQALAERGGWDAIAQKPEWGLFKFGHTHPNQSNSGLMTLALMAGEYHKKTRDLTLKDILDGGFQEWMGALERSTSGMSNSTGNMMREMVLKGPSSFDALFVYESVVLDYLKSAEGRWGNLRISYPQVNMWNENPYYIIRADWVSKDQAEAAETFLKFLYSEPVQRESLTHGFRPGNPSVPIRFTESPFVKYQSSGVRIDVGTISEAPSADVINNLLASWQRSQGSR